MIQMAWRWLYPFIKCLSMYIAFYDHAFVLGVCENSNWICLSVLLYKAKWIMQLQDCCIFLLKLAQEWLYSYLNIHILFLHHWFLHDINSQEFLSTILLYFLFVLICAFGSHDAFTCLIVQSKLVFRWLAIKLANCVIQYGLKWYMRSQSKMMMMLSPSIA